MAEELKREELERELVVYDKQKLITQCLKLFDSNKRLAHELSKSRGAFRKTQDLLFKKQEELKKLKDMSGWKFVTRKWRKDEAERTEGAE